MAIKFALVSLDKARGAIYPGQCCHALCEREVYVTYQYSMQSCSAFALMEKLVWKVSVLQVNALVHAVHSFPAHTPKRWTLVSELVTLAAAYEEGDKGTFIELQVPSKSRNTGELLSNGNNIII